MTAALSCATFGGICDIQNTANGSRSYPEEGFRMAGKKLKSEVESVRGDIKELTEAVWAIREYLTTERAVAAAEQQARGHQPSQARATAMALEEHGVLSTCGAFKSEDGSSVRRTYRWSLHEQPIGALLAGPADRYAQVLAAIGHRQRLGILLHLLSHPSTATELVTSLSLGTTGAAYHHLNVLQAAGLVDQERRGRFMVPAERVPALLTILAGLSGAIEVDVEIGEEAAVETDEAPVEAT